MSGRRQAARLCRFDAVLFDLDGTLIDSAPDLAAAANHLLEMRGRPPLAYERLRVHAGSGARGMLGAAFDLRPGDAGYAALRDEFYAHYQKCLLDTTRCFAATPALLDRLAMHGVPWGIVTNKQYWFAAPQVRALGIEPPHDALVCGDSTPHTKPHPAPLLEAARRLGVASEHCVYVGDDARDIQAGRAAGMAAVAAAWGYLGAGAEPVQWGADAVLADMPALLHWLELA